MLVNVDKISLIKWIEALEKDERLDKGKLFFFVKHGPTFFIVAFCIVLQGKIQVRLGLNAF